jgi:hypothetical protein
MARYQGAFAKWYLSIISGIQIAAFLYICMPMKKLLPLLLLLHTFSHAQNWQCLQYGVKHYFINGNGYLRGIRIDSVRTSGSDIFYYPFHTPRGSYGHSSGAVLLDSLGGSWLGKKVIQQNDGTFLFDNFWNDTVVIKTQAHPGDSWTFYNDTTDLYYRAEVTGTDTMTVLGTVDSIKKIIITAYNSSGIVATDPLDSFQIFLSKTNGFVQIFDLFTFPYRQPGSAYSPGTDYYLDKSANEFSVTSYQFTLPYTGINKKTQIFQLVSLFNPTTEQMYDWNVGDVYHYSWCDGSFQWYGAICDPASQYTKDTIVSINVLSTGIEYISYGIKHEIMVPYSTIFLNPFISYTYSTTTYGRTFACDHNAVIDTILMPEEYKQKMLFYYTPDDTSYCISSPLYIVNLGHIRGNSYYPDFEGAWITNIYKNTLGLVYRIGAGVDWGYIIGSQKLLYYNRGGTSCGTIISAPTLVKEIGSSKSHIEVYPNPTTNTITISSIENITTLTINNLLGQTAYNSHPNSGKAEINVSHIPPGIYLIKINDSIVKKFIKEN